MILFGNSKNVSSRERERESVFDFEYQKVKNIVGNSQIRT